MQRVKLDQTEYRAWMSNQQCVVNEGHNVVRMIENPSIVSPDTLLDAKNSLAEGERIVFYKDYLRHAYFTSMGPVCLQHPNNRPLESVSHSPFTGQKERPKIIRVKTDVGELDYKEPDECMCQKTWRRQTGNPHYISSEHHETCIFKDAVPVPTLGG